jgi:hypothetical protein
VATGISSSRCGPIRHREGPVNAGTQYGTSCCESVCRGVGRSLRVSRGRTLSWWPELVLLTTVATDVSVRSYSAFGASCASFAEVTRRRRVLFGVALAAVIASGVGFGASELVGTGTPTACGGLQIPHLTEPHRVPKIRMWCSRGLLFETASLSGRVVVSVGEGRTPPLAVRNSHR